MGCVSAVLPMCDKFDSGALCQCLCLCQCKVEMHLPMRRQQPWGQMAHQGMVKLIRNSNLWGVAWGVVWAAAVWEAAWAASAAAATSKPVLAHVALQKRGLPRGVATLLHTGVFLIHFEESTFARCRRADGTPANSEVDSFVVSVQQDR